MLPPSFNKDGPGGDLVLHRCGYLHRRSGRQAAARACTTRVQLKLKEDARRIARGASAARIIRKHSTPFPSPFTLGRPRTGQPPDGSLAAAAARGGKKDYDDFYKQLTLDFEPPLAHAHMVVDAPAQIYAILYVPANSERDISRTAKGK